MDVLSVPCFARSTWNLLGVSIHARISPAAGFIGRAACIGVECFCHLQIMLAVTSRLHPPNDRFDVHNLHCA